MAQFRRFILPLLLCFLSSQTIGQQLYSGNAKIDSAFRLALWTLDTNTHNGLIHAGAGYGGEWTRDAAINCWNAASLLRPSAAEATLWSVTKQRQTIGHQYWDKIIWTLAAWNHYLVTGDEAFLRQSYACAALTMSELEDSCFDNKYQLFMGPAVFQDGIAGYDEPIYDPQKWDDSFVLHHPNSSTIKCLSTNLIYLQSYRTLAQMADALGDTAAPRYSHSAANLKESLLSHFYNPSTGRLYYLIDHRGIPHSYQEGLGVAFALLFDLLPPESSSRLVDSTFTSPFGIPCVYPSFPRNSPDKPGRHNMMIWPHVNMLFASGCAHQGYAGPFYFELNSLANLAMRYDGGNFYEIYTLEGEPSGGWQCGALWGKKSHQTWCATGFIRLVVNHIFGLTPTLSGLELHPMGMNDGNSCRLSGIPYRNAMLDITIIGHGNTIGNCHINGRKSAPFIPANATGSIQVEIQLQ